MQLTHVTGKVTKISEVIKYFNGGLLKSHREQKKSKLKPVHDIQCVYNHLRATTSEVVEL